MIIETTRFGSMEIDEQKIIKFRPGLLAFEDLSDYALIDIAENRDFKWLQSMKEPDLSFLLVDPFIANPDYRVELQAEMMEKLNIAQAEDVLIYTIVTVPAGGFKESTTNLVGPLVINWREKKGVQVVLEKDGLDVKYPLFKKAA
ncbi:MAG: flagellar assembly protein FliW [Syntrophomonadaceae bacterium]